MDHPVPRAPSGGLARRTPSGRVPANPEYSSVTGMENAIHGAATPAEAHGSRWLLPGVIPAEIILGNALLLMVLPSLAQLTGQAVVQVLLLINMVLAVGLVTAFRGTGRNGDRRLATALGSIVVASFFDWFVVLAAGTNASAFVLALLFAVPLVALALGVGSAVRATRSLRSETRLPQPTSHTPGLGNGTHGMLS